MNKYAIFFRILIPVGLIFLALAIQKEIRKNYNFIKINNETLKIEIADTFFKRVKGLSGRKDFLEAEGMMFVFKKPGIYPFWMRGMFFPLDFVWLDENFEVVRIDKNIQPTSSPQSLNPPKPIKYVLEIKAGLAEKCGLKLSDKIIFNN